MGFFTPSPIKGHDIHGRSQKLADVTTMFKKQQHELINKGMGCHKIMCFPSSETFKAGCELRETLEAGAR